MDKRWSDLPKDLLSTMASCLATGTDLRHFRAVCTSWQSSTPLPSKTSLKIPFPLSPTSPKNNCHYSLTESTIYCIQPLNKITNTKSWFIKLAQNTTEANKMLLVDPLSKLVIHKFPKTMVTPLNSLDYKVTEVAKEFSIDAGVFNYQDSKLNLVRKVVTSSSTTVDDNFMVFVLLNNALSVWKMGDEMWTFIDDKGEDTKVYHDVVFYKGKFYVVKYNGCVLVIDSSSFNVTEIASNNVGHDGGVYTTNHLVVSFGELFLLAKDPIVGRGLNVERGQVYWKAYKLNEEKNVWDLVNSLGDRAFFMGITSFTVSALDFPGCKRNSIYFEDGIFSRRMGHTPGYNGGIYDLEDGKVGRLSAFTGYSKIFWPPPTWLKRNATSS